MERAKCVIFRQNDLCICIYVCVCVSVYTGADRSYNIFYLIFFVFLFHKRAHIVDPNARRNTHTQYNMLFIIFVFNLITRVLYVSSSVRTK